MKRYHFASIDSTQTYARQFVTQRDPILITSSIQTGGIGQRGKSWISPPGNLYLSYLCYLPSMNPLYIAQIVGLSLVYTLHEYEIRPQIKWVNDLLLNDKKLCGILCENHEQVFIIGIGLNVNTEPELFNSLKKATGKYYDLEELLDRIIQRLHKTVLRIGR